MNLPRARGASVKQGSAIGARLKFKYFGGRSFVFLSRPIDRSIVGIRVALRPGQLADHSR